MARKSNASGVAMGFEKAGIRVAIANIRPLKAVPDTVKKSPKYLQIVASIADVGIIEPPVVARDRGERGKFLLLDGHLRIEALKDMGETEATCLVSTDDEAFTYNKRVNRLAIIQEHKMILKAIERGVSEARIAKALNVDVERIKVKRRLLDGICPEAIELLKDKHIGVNSFAELRRMVPLRQIEAAELMVAMNKYTISYAKSLVAATPISQLLHTRRPKRVQGLSEDQMALMERESANLDREFKIAEQSYGSDHLDLVLAKGYLAKLLGNARVVRYLAQNAQEILGEFQKLADLESSAA
ncbi:MAG: plasmid partitioning protein RepB C-terminal domain-containing protein [Parvibaculum sp.]|uniref:plasmid partitioning protein RepB C-terminal domain-containing protein n=1 Tax=Parvibaculum sp. TaxID=2024848 RepID=UPI00283E89EC|nr:plasmid partitioning protein RepB C-terminal domain-containing protein [Parvibaculum sp.]MDR3500697.1 plasmid partitioning protein RepB C-terminal domain-containing protein [Parvibaculum sp.]